MKEVNLSLSPAGELEDIPGFGPEMSTGSFSVRFGDQPIAHRLSDVFSNFELPIPKSLQLFKIYDVWIVPHQLGIVRNGGLSEVTSVGVEIKFHSDGDTRSVVSLFPSTEYVELGGISFKGEISAFLSPTGDLSTAVDSLSGTFESKSASDEKKKLSKEILGLSCTAAFGGSAAINLCAKVVTPKISAIGRGSSHPQWQFAKHDLPLHGRDLEMWSFIVVPKYLDEIKFDAKFSVVHRTLFVPIRKETEWETITCKLGV